MKEHGETCALSIFGIGGAQRISWSVTLGLREMHIVMMTVAFQVSSILQSNAQGWVVTDAPKTNWYSIALSADGSKLVAAASLGGVFTSTNGGTNWMLSSPSPATLVASSADGTKLIAVGSNRPFAVSTNSGATWTTRILPVTNSVDAVASSADGTKLIAVGKSVLSSIDSGITWTNYPNPAYWLTRVASSADGSKLAAGHSGTPIYTSTDYGATWTPTSLTVSLMEGLACSADGNKLVVATQTYSNSSFMPGPIYVSANFGASWTQTTAPIGYWGPVASSADGTKLLALGAVAWFSNDSGSTWNSIGATNHWARDGAVSADGNKLAVASQGGDSSGVYNGSIYLTQSTPTPTLKVRSSNNGLVISWLVPSRPFVLQANPDLNTDSWTNVVPTPILNCVNLEYEMTVPIPQGSMFYRLKSDES